MPPCHGPCRKTTDQPSPLSRSTPPLADSSAVVATWSVSTPAIPARSPVCATRSPTTSPCSPSMPSAPASTPSPRSPRWVHRRPPKVFVSYPVMALWRSIGAPPPPMVRPSPATWSPWSGTIRDPASSSLDSASVSITPASSMVWSTAPSTGSAPSPSVSSAKAPRRSLLPCDRRVPRAPPPMWWLLLVRVRPRCHGARPQPMVLRSMPTPCRSLDLRCAPAPTGLRYQSATPVSSVDSPTVFLCASS
ncbi:unannotated protein [freshwater metagenome]|uniref:Unannotated protein n=1 Tax=freshwater metagenome TaxID=449393 RepID=A0A6J5YFF1_9ZZZZ